MDEAQFITVKELRALADICEALNEKVAGTELSLGTTEVYDCNGEVVGYLAFGEGDYSYYPKRPKDVDHDE
jgi:hypothetical protein